ncbi:MAG: hypothetical protein ACLS4Z_07175 [Christensenellaceae bacterium]
MLPSLSNPLRRKRICPKSKATITSDTTALYAKLLSERLGIELNAEDLLKPDGETTQS